MTVILMGVFTRVHRRTGIIGLAIGLTYGISAIIAEAKGWGLPVWYTNTWWAYLWNLILPAGSMLIASKVIDWLRGPINEEEIKGTSLFPGRSNSGSPRTDGESFESA